MKKYKISLYIALFCSVILGITIYEYTFYRQSPDTIYLQKGEREELEFALPVTGELTSKEASYIETWESGQTGIKASGSVAGDHYIWKLRLFGVIPLKEADGREVCPCSNILQVGDYILSINGESVSLKGEVIDKIKACEGESVIMTIRRNGQVSSVKVLPVLNNEGNYQIGVWIRDSAQGIGTLTYIDEENEFGALGHGINDIDTTDLMEINYGGLYETQIISIKKGESGEPGEISGVIRFVEDAREGIIKLNTVNGIYGVMDKSPKEAGVSEEELYPVALKQNIRLGDAQILCTINGETNAYDVQITDIDYSQSEGNRGLVIQITDPVLLSQTGGIVQGMSGSPIVQDGKFIGAVTHVFVNDPTKGYGIFAETMLHMAQE